MLAYDYPLGGVLLSMLYFFLFFIWIWILITVFMDIFRSSRPQRLEPRRCGASSSSSSRSSASSST